MADLSRIAAERERRGTAGQVDGQAYVLGNHRLIEERGQCNPELEAKLLAQEHAGRSVTLLASDQGVLALFAVADTLHPDRIDLGVGRSLGFTAPVRDALGVHDYGPEHFARDLEELTALLAGTAAVTAMPKGVPAPPLLVLATGSGLAVAARCSMWSRRFWDRCLN